MKKRFDLKRKGALVLAILVMLTGVTSVMAYSPPFHDYSFYMQAHGGIDSSSSWKKETSDKFACVYLKTIDTYESTSLPLTMRVRDRKDNYATEKQSFSKEKKNFMIGMDYLSGQGKVDKSYYLRMQTNSQSAYSATVTGVWRP